MKTKLMSCLFCVGVGLVPSMASSMNEEVHYIQQQLHPTFHYQESLKHLILFFPQQLTFVTYNLYKKTLKHHFDLHPI